MKIKMLRSYHTVEVYEDGKWLPQFGDYSFRVARDEEKHLKDSFNLDGTKAKTRIVTTQKDKK